MADSSNTPLAHPAPNAILSLRLVRSVHNTELEPCVISAINGQRSSSCGTNVFVTRHVIKASCAQTLEKDDVFTSWPHMIMPSSRLHAKRYEGVRPGFKIIIRVRSRKTATPQMATSQEVYLYHAVDGIWTRDGKRMRRFYSC